MSNNRTITMKDLTHIKRLRTIAIKHGKTEFMYRGLPILVAYAGYLIQYMNNIKEDI